LDEGVLNVAMSHEKNSKKKIATNSVVEKQKFPILSAIWFGKMEIALP
jgi:hypothetical protein